ncbi:MAG TPA: hypothetical protein VGV59_01685 [Pyrinomonadaceae bacterium]|nr:hypothetical protein [Pyrinomonadaceae bacterium]
MSSTPGHRLGRYGAASALVLVLACAVTAQKTAPQCKPRQVKFERGASSIVLRGRLEPCEQRIYKLRALRGQKLEVVLLPAENDVVFWLFGREPAERHALVLDGVHRNGVTQWTGELQFTGDYEIRLGRPPVSASDQQQTLPYRLEVRIRSLQTR